MAIAFQEPDEDIDDLVDDVDHSRGALTAEELREVERFANECFAELRVGKPWREAWSLANQPDPPDFGPQDPPLRVKGKSWQDDALSAVFRAGPAPATRTPQILADGLLAVSRPEGTKAPTGPAVHDGNSVVVPAPVPRVNRVSLVRAVGLPPRVIFYRSFPTHTPKGPHGMAQQEILDALTKGPLGRADLIAATGLSGTILDSTLQSLRRKATIAQDGRGMPWRLTASSSSAAKSLEEIAARRTKGTEPRGGRRAPSRAADKSARKAPAKADVKVLTNGHAVNTNGLPAMPRLLEDAHALRAELAKKLEAIDTFIAAVSS